METPLYQPPEGTYDQPFTYALDASDLVDGQNALNLRIYVIGGWGDFILRRMAGFRSVLNPATGKFQTYHSPQSPVQSDPVFVTPEDDRPVIPELLFPETWAIRLDLYDVLKDAS